MLDAGKILDELQRQAGEFAREARLDDRLGDARAAASDLRQRLETDPKARTLAAGAGGLLLLGLIGSKGGRRMIGDVAKLGLTAGLGALAYRAWSRRRGAEGAGAPRPEDLRSAGYLLETNADPDFARALVHAMVGAAAADGVTDQRERAAIEAALIRAGADEGDRRLLLNEMTEADRIAEIAKGASTPTRAAQLYAAAAVVADAGNSAEAGFLGRLADALSISPEDAAAIRAGA